MTVVLITSTNRYIGDTADTKPTGVPAGSTYFDRQTGILYITYDGTNYVEKPSEDTLATLLAGGLPAALAAGGGLKTEGVAGGVAQPVSAASLPLPSGASTSALQGGGLPSALAAGGGLKVEGVVGGVAQPVSGTVTADTELPAAAALADATANPTVPMAGAALMVYNGTTWDRVRGVATGMVKVAFHDHAGSTLGSGTLADARSNAVTRLEFGAFGQAFNGTTWDRLRSIASSGAGLGVQQVGILGEAITLAASAARTATAGTNGTAVTGLGWRHRYIIILDVTAAATEVDDTLDAYVDVSPDGSMWLNAAHFTQCLGNGGAKRYFAVLEATSPGTAVIDASSDAAVGVVRPTLSGEPQMRARWVIVDPSGANASFTFSVAAYAI